MITLIRNSLILALIIFQPAIGNEILNRYLTLAAENNPGLKSTFLEYQAALEKIPQAGSLPDPQISFGYFIQPVETRVGPQQARISVMQMFPWFGTLDAQESVATLEAKAHFENFEKAKSDVFYNVRVRFFELYFTKQNISITEENLEILNSIKELVTGEIMAGKASVADEILVEIELGEFQNELIKYREQYQAELAKFRNLLNVESDFTLVMPDSLQNNDLTLNSQEIRAKIVSNNPDLQGIDYLYQSFLEKEKLAGKSGRPKFSLGMDYIFVGERNVDGMQVENNGKDAIIFPMISFSLPLYRGKYSGQSREAQFKQQATLNKKEDAINHLESVLEDAVWAYRDADRRFNLYRRQQELARKALAIMEADYQNQSKSLEDLLQMERKIINYDVAAEQALTDKQTSIALIKYLMGE